MSLIHVLNHKEQERKITYFMENKPRTAKAWRFSTRGRAGAPEAEADGHSQLPSCSGQQGGHLLPLLPLGKKDARNHKMLGSTLRKKWPGLRTLSICFCSTWWWRQKHILLSYCLNLNLKYSIRRQCKILLRKSEFLIIL